MLDVCESRDGGWWNPDHGDVEVPDGWQLLPSGDAHLIRSVKQFGAYRSAWPSPPSPAHHRRVGAVRQHRPGAADWLRTPRPVALPSDNVPSDGATGKKPEYQHLLADAIVAYLDFADQHAEFARQIADGAAAPASQVGSERVGRTRILDLYVRARLAGRAHIRHHHTDYDDRLLEAQMQTGIIEVDDNTYRRIRRDAATAISTHARPVHPRQAGLPH